MATCRECLRYEVCRADGNIFSHIISDHDVASDICPHFKDKTKYVDQKHGHWISLTDCSNAGVYCSVCQKKVWKEDYAWCNRKNKLRSNYCPNCGAKMDLEE